METRETEENLEAEAAREKFRKGLEKIVKPADLDVLKEECPTDPKIPLAESAENIGK